MSKKRLSYEELVGLSRQLALVVDSDLSIQEGIDLILEQTLTKNVAVMLRSIKKEIMDGKTLGQAIKKDSYLIPGYYRDMIQVGEESGNLHSVLLNIAESYEKDIKTAKRVRSAITYPVVLTFLMLGVIVLLITTVMPMFEDILNSLGGEIPAFTSVLINTSSYLGENILIILGFIVVLLLAVDIYKNTKSGKIFFDKLKLKIPIQKDIVTSLAALRFSRNMAMLIKSGIPTAKALSMIRPLLGNEVLSQKLDIATDLVKEGNPLKIALSGISLFPKLIVKLLVVAEATGHLEDIFNKTADMMSEDLDGRLEKLTTVLEPLLIILLSIILGVILLSVIFPVISIMNSIG